MPGEMTAGTTRSATAKATDRWCARREALSPRFAATAGLCVVFLQTFSLCSARAQDSVADFYRGRVVEIVTPTAAGGGFDTSARLVARHLGRYLPGAPTFTVRNMPGGGGIREANYIFNVAPKDGTSIGLLGRDVAMVNALGRDTGVQFVARRFDWIGSLSSFRDDAYVLMARPGAAWSTIDEGRKPDARPLIVGGTGEGNTDGDVPKIMRDTMGVNIRQVLGYTDSQSLFLAMERGEIEARTFDLSNVKATRPQWLSAESGYRVLAQFGRRTRHPDLPDTPTAREAAMDAGKREVVEFAETPLLTMARPFALPPGSPPERVAALAKAFAEMSRDSAFLDEASKLGIDVSPSTPAEINGGIDFMEKASPSTKDYMRNLLAH